MLEAVVRERLVKAENCLAGVVVICEFLGLPVAL
jgi:hypothetical protein